MTDEWNGPSDRRGDVLTLNTDEVRRVVRDENRGLADGIKGLMVATEKMTDAVQDLVAESRVNEEKFASINSRIRRNGKEAEEVNKAVLHLSSVVIPELEHQVALNGFSLTAFWKVVGIVSAPILGIGAFLYREIGLRDKLITDLVEAIHTHTTL